MLFQADAMPPSVSAMPPAVDAMASTEGAMPTDAGTMLCRNECCAVHKRFNAFRSRCNVVQRGVYFSNYGDYLYCRGYFNNKYRQYIISKKFGKDVFACGLVAKAMDVHSQSKLIWFHCRNDIV